MDKVLSRILVKLVQYFKTREGDFVRFGDQNYWQSHGFSIIPNHYHSPIPDLGSLDNKIFVRPSQLPGIDLRDNGQIALLRKLSRYAAELRDFKQLTSKVDSQKDPKFYFGNLAFDNFDACIYYLLLREIKPKRVIEVGSGWSTKIAAAAVLKNTDAELIAIEPYPQPILARGFPGLSKLIIKKIEEVPLSFFKKLDEGDVLFIDSSHTVKIGGDVNYLFLEILPRLKKGVWVHIHDIFLPWEYPKKWAKEEFRFWNEQYLLQAFLIFNTHFQVAITNAYLGNKYMRLLKNLFPGVKKYGGGSFWLRKVR